MEKRLTIFLILISLTGLYCSRGEQADLILYNGKIITVDSGFSIAEAIAVHGDRILLVGSNNEVL